MCLSECKQGLHAAHARLGAALADLYLLPCMWSAVCQVALVDGVLAVCCHACKYLSYHWWSAQVGGFVMMHRDDLAKLVPQWLQRTVGLRADAEAARLAGEAASNRAGQLVKCGPPQP